MEHENKPRYVRIVPDAVVGAGMVLRGGDVVPAERLGEHLGFLLSAGAVEPVSDLSLSSS